MILRAENISMKFTGGGLHDFSFKSVQGGITVISGESGIGKTTLLNIITGMLHPDRGRVYADEKEIFNDMTKTERIKLAGSKIGYMMQGASLIPSLSVEENLTLPMRIAGGTYKKPELDEILGILKIEKLRCSYPGRLSGGEYRRVLLAGVLLQKPEIIVADEPTSNLDRTAAETVRSILCDYITPQTSAVIATHDEKFFDTAAQRIDLSGKQ